MSESNRLRGLQVGEARHDRRCVFRRQVHERALVRNDAGIDPVDRIPDPESEIRNDLVIARTRRVKAAGGIANDLFQALLDIHVNVFEVT